MAIEYDLHFNSDMKNVELLEKIAQNLSMSIEQTSDKNAIHIDNSTTYGYMLSILEDFKIRLKIKETEYSFSRTWIFRIEKSKLSFGINSTLSVVLMLVEQYKFPCILVANGEEIILINDTVTGLVLNKDCELFNDVVLDDLTDFAFRSFSINDFVVI